MTSTLSELSTVKAMDGMIANVRNTLARQKGGTLVSEKRADGAVLWRVAYAGVGVEKEED